MPQIDTCTALPPRDADTALPPRPLSQTTTALLEIAPRVQAARDAVLSAKSSVHCSRCDSPVPQLLHGRSLPCPVCRTRLAIPAFVPLGCERCGDVLRIRPRELGVARRCPSCGLPLGAPVLKLPAARHHARRRAHHRGWSPHNNAVWTILLTSVALLSALVLLGRL